MVKQYEICILDYGSGNVRSVYNLFSSIIRNVKVSALEQDIKSATHLVLPGVGAFGATMEKIRKNLSQALLTEQVIIQKKPLLGICVGMQVLASKGMEFGEYEGLNWIPGSVDVLPTTDHPLPHVGWNDISFVDENSPLAIDLQMHKDFYFVHKYAFTPNDPSHIVATTDYGSSFCSVIKKDNIYGFQFHPEKSQQAGRKIALNFLACT